MHGTLRASQREWTTCIWSNMPKSKREKPVYLTKVKSKGQEQRSSNINVLRDAIDEYSYIYTFTWDSMRTESFNPVRMQWRDSRFFMGKNKVTAVALGRNEDEEYRANLHLVAQQLKGNVGLLLTNRGRAEVLDYFRSYEVADFARVGQTASETVQLEAGPLDAFVSSQFEYVRKLGLPVRLDDGVVVLEIAHTVCQKGAELTAAQTKVLQLLGRKIGRFSVSIVSEWSDGKFEKLE